MWVRLVDKKGILRIHLNDIDASDIQAILPLVGQSLMPNKGSEKELKCPFTKSCKLDIFLVRKV